MDSSLPGKVRQHHMGSGLSGANTNSLPSAAMSSQSTRPRAPSPAWSQAPLSVASTWTHGRRLSRRGATAMHGWRPPKRSLELPPWHGLELLTLGGRREEIRRWRIRRSGIFDEGVAVSLVSVVDNLLPHALVVACGSRCGKGVSGRTMAANRWGSQCLGFLFYSFAKILPRAQEHSWHMFVVSSRCGSFAMKLFVVRALPRVFFREYAGELRIIVLRGWKIFCYNNTWPLRRMPTHPLGITRRCDLGWTWEHN
jgi:hypothetical protein